MMISPPIFFQACSLVAYFGLSVVLIGLSLRLSLRMTTTNVAILSSYKGIAEQWSSRSISIADEAITHVPIALPRLSTYSTAVTYLETSRDHLRSRSKRSELSIRDQDTVVEDWAPADHSIAEESSSDECVSHWDWQRFLDPHERLLDTDNEDHSIAEESSSDECVSYWDWQRFLIPHERLLDTDNECCSSMRVEGRSLSEVSINLQPQSDSDASHSGETETGNIAPERDHTQAHLRSALLGQPPFGRQRFRITNAPSPGRDTEQADTSRSFDTYNVPPSRKRADLLGLYRTATPSELPSSPPPEGTLRTVSEPNSNPYANYATESDRRTNSVLSFNTSDYASTLSSSSRYDGLVLDDGSKNKILHGVRKQFRKIWKRKDDTARDKRPALSRVPRRYYV
jgi:hypothetical protein